jgi:hypothetical protein
MQIQNFVNISPVGSTKRGIWTTLYCFVRKKALRLTLCRLNKHTQSTEPGTIPRITSHVDYRKPNLQNFQHKMMRCAEE